MSRMAFSVIRLGFEPKTHSLEGCCSIQLSYRTNPDFLVEIDSLGKVGAKVVKIFGIATDFCGLFSFLSVDFACVLN